MIRRETLAVDTIVISSQHSADTDIETVREGIRAQVSRPVIPAEYMDEHTKIYVNPRDVS